MMGFWQPVTNLKDYTLHNPPVVTFFFCLLSLAISFICLGSYSYTHTLPNPDVAKDWNYLLSSLSQLKLCRKSEADDLVSRVPPHPIEQEHNIKTTSTQTSPSVTSLQLQVHLNVTPSPASGSVDGLYTTLKASQLYLGGNEIVNVTLDFLSGKGALTCLTISAPTHLLPPSLLPPKCPAFERNNLPVHVEVSNDLLSASEACYSLLYNKDPTLTVMLTQREQSVAARHQLEVSVFLLVVCFMLCLAASVTHWLTCCSHVNGLDLKNDPLIDA